MDDVDAFMASLEQFAAPSINTGIVNANHAATSEVAVHGSTRAGPRGRGSTRRARTTDSVTEREPGVWRCTACRTLNVCGDCCTTCHRARAVPDVESGPREVACERCTFLNDSRRTTCAMCDAALPSVQLPALQNASRDRHGDYPVPSPAATRLRHGGEYSVSDTSQTSSTATPDDASVSDDETGSEVWDDDEDTQVSAKAHALEAHVEDVVDDTELVRVVQELATVPFDDLPCASVPATMQESGQLRPFQLQALHWMLTRESGGGGHDGAAGVRRLAPFDPNTRAAATRRAPPPCPSSATAADPSVGDVQAVRGGILADHTGMGKTRTLVALCESTRGPRYDRVVGSQVASAATLIICPTSLLMQWRQEMVRCVRPMPRILVYHGRCKQRLSLFALAQEYDYVLTSYQSLCHEPAATADPPGKMYMIRWHRVVLDEAHHIRNTRTRQFRVCCGLDAVHRWAITATPVQSTLNDLHSVLRFLKVPYFSSVAWWNEVIVRGVNENAAAPRPLAALRLLFSVLLLRRTPDSLVRGQPITALPPRHERVCKVALTKEQRAFYDQTHRIALDKFQRLLGPRGGPHCGVLSTVNEMLVRCQQCCLHPYILVSMLRRACGEAAATGQDGPAAQQSKIDHYVDEVVVPRLRVQGGADTEFVQSLLTTLKEGTLTKRECMICLDAIKNPAILPCAHVFCSECIHNAFELGRRCPLCKQPVRPASVVYLPGKLFALHDDDEVMATSVKADLGQFGNWPVGLSAKTVALLEAIARIPGDEKAVVFSSCVGYLDYLKYCLDEASIACALFTGALTMRQKAAVMRTFDDEGDVQDETAGPRVLLVALATCSVGINLRRANHCFLMEPPLNPTVVEQALNRVHHIGQTRTVHIVTFVASNTVEEKIQARCASRRGSPGSRTAARRGLAAVGSDVGKPSASDLLALFDDVDASGQ